MRLSVLVLVLIVLAGPLAAEAQPTAKVWRIGYLSLASAESDRSWVGAFRRGLHELGYVEAQNIIIEERHAAGRSERLPELAAELVRLKVVVLVTYGGIAAAKQATSRIPIVMTVHADPVGAGFVASLARPGGNITGLSDSHADIVAKRLSLLKEVAPSASRIAVFWNPTNLSALPQFKSIQAAARALGLTVLSWEARGPDDIDRAFAAVGRARPDALLVIPEPMFLTHRRRMAELAEKQRLPAIGTVRQWAEAGILMSYGTNFDDLWRRAATYVDKILKGAKPGDLPVEQPTKFTLVINLKTAKALGLNVPPSLLLRADHVIE